MAGKDEITLGMLSITRKRVNGTRARITIDVFEGHFAVPLGVLAVFVLVVFAGSLAAGLLS